MKKSLLFVISLLVAGAMVLGACAPAAAPTQAPVATEAPVATQAPVATEAPVKSPGLQMDAAKVATQFWSEAEYEESIKFMQAESLNPDEPIYLQSLLDNPVDTTQYQKEPPFNICFSNAGVNNQWRVTGYVTMREQVEQLRAEGLIKNFIHVDAEGSDEKQIADIADLVAGGECDLLIVSPNTSEALTPAVEKACEALPIVVFDRGVLTNCPTSFLKTIGGYAFGYSGAKFVVDNLPNGGNVLALRILPGVDVLEQRWGAARKVFEAAGNINVVGVEFDDYSGPKTKAIVSDYLDRFGKIDAIWMDAGGPAVAALEAFQDAGQPFPVMVGEDQMDYLKFWKENNLTAIAPSFPTFQWRTAVLASVMILQGESVPKRWVLPQPDVTQANLDTYYLPDMPPLYYALSSAEDMKNWPAVWKALDTTKYVDVLP